MSAGPIEGPVLPPGGRVAIPGRGRPWVWDTGPRPGAPTIVLIHGWMSTAALTWQHVFSPLEGQARVVAPDLRGHGRGIHSPRPFRLVDAADDVAALVTALGCGPVFAVGYSMGGPVAQLLWRRHRRLVAGLVLCATAARFAQGWSSRMMAATGFGIGVGLSTVPGVARRTMMQRAARAQFPPDASPRLDWAASEWGAADPAGLFGAGAALLRYDASAWIGTVDVPTGVIVTARDETVPPASQRRLAAAIPNAFVIPVDGGHRCCVERPEVFVPALRAACGRVAAGEDRP